MRAQRPGRRLAVGMGAALVAAVAAAVITVVTGGSGEDKAAAGPAGSPQREQYFADAAKEFNVPENVLLAVSYNLTRGEGHDNQPAADGSVGPMALIDSRAITGTSGKGSAADRSAAPNSTSAAPDMLDKAATLLHEPRDQVSGDEQQNIRGGAAVLADLARANGGTPSSPEGWHKIVGQYTGAPSSEGQQAFADDVFDTLRQGISYTTHDGQSLRSAPVADLKPATQAAPATTAQDAKSPDTPTSTSSGAPSSSATSTSSSGAGAPAGQKVECPSGLKCRFVPAAYDWSSDDHSNPNNYGNYDPANRPADGNQVRYIVIHDTEAATGADGSPYDQALRAFQSPAGQSSAHYVIRSSDGAITQMVPTKDVAWHAGNWNINEESIGIEHEGISAEGGTWYTEQMYEASAKLVRYLAAKYHIPLDRQHILGHDDVITDKVAKIAGAHTDPGVYWDWNHYLQLLGAPSSGSGSSDELKPGEAVTIHPDYASNKPPVTQCDKNGCTPLAEHGTNFLPLHTQPAADSPLITDKQVYPKGTPDGQALDDWTDKAVAGRTYVVAAQSGDWTAIWYDGQQAWFENPDGKNVTRARSVGQVATAPAGQDSAPLYSRAFPEKDEYPSEITFDPSWELTPLAWTLPAGQQYQVVGEFTASNYYARYDGANLPLNHQLVQGGEKYLMLSYNHRYVWAKAADVQVKSAK